MKRKDNGEKCGEQKKILFIFTRDIKHKRFGYSLGDVWWCSTNVANPNSSTLLKWTAAKKTKQPQIH